MLKKFFTIFLLLTLLAVFSYAKSSVNDSPKYGASFLKVYGWDDNESSSWISGLNDGNYVLTGTFYNVNDDTSFFKISSLGEVIDYRAYSWAGQDFGREILPTSDGGYIIAGITTSFNDEYELSNAPIFLLKLNSDLTVAWAKFLPQSVHVSFKNPRVFELEDGYLLFGSITLSDKDEILIMKLNSSGEKVWAYVYDGDCNCSAYVNSVIRTSDGNLVVLGKYLFGGIVYGLIFKVTPSGDILWVKRYKSSVSNDFEFHGASEDSSGNLVVVGCYSIYTGKTLQYIFFTVSVSSDGSNILFQKEFPIDLVDYKALDMSVNCEDDGGYFFTLSGIPLNSGWSGRCGYMIRLSSSLNILWAYRIGDGSDEYFLNRGLITSQGEHISFGSTDDSYFSFGGVDILGILLDSEGNISGECDYLVDVSSDLTMEDLDFTIYNETFLKTDYDGDFVDKTEELTVFGPTDFDLDEDKVCNGGGSGDLNGDGEVSSLDFVLLASYLAGNNDGSGLNLDNADMNGDGKIDATDLTLLLIEITY